MAKMPSSMYYIVEFLASPRPDVDKYVCVPGTWIRWIDETNSTVGVAYPSGNPAEIERLARMNQEDPNYWLAYKASVKYCTSSYEQPKNYLKVLREIGSSRTVSNVPTNQRLYEEAKNCFKDLREKGSSRTVSNVPTNQSLYEEAKNCFKDLRERGSSRTISNVATNQSLYEKTKYCFKDLRETGSSRTVSNVPTNKRSITKGQTKLRPAARTSNSASIDVNKTALLPVITNVSTSVSMPQTKPQQNMPGSAETAKHSSVGTQCPVRNDHLNRSLQASSNSHPISVSQHNKPSITTQNISHGCQRPGTSSDQAYCASKLDVVLRNVQTNIQKLATEFNQWVTVNAKNNEKILEIGAWMKDYQVWKRSVESQISERPPMSEMPRKIKAEIILIEDDDVNHEKSTIPTQMIPTQEPRGVQQRIKAQFTLPPEYDRNDSRWTLRYRYPEPTLRELIPHSRIYVDTIKLGRALLSARDCKSLARLLLMEVFSDNALKVCSLTGARTAKHSSCPDRPGLDENARNTLMKYVEKYGRQKGWRIPDNKAMNSTMRNKLHDCRRRLV